MSQQGDLDQMMAVVVRKVCDELTDIELNTLYLSVLLGTNPKNVLGYTKAESLFTEEDGKKMHQVTSVVFGAIWEERIGGKR